MLKKTLDILKKTFQSESKKEAIYYTELFVNNFYWNTKNPNEEEKLRWAIIEEFLQKISSEVHSILDLGCGRGWLTNLLSNYGTVLGIEPIKDVVVHAKKMFPEINFICGTSKDLLKEKNFKKFDLVVSSEVIEHIPEKYKQNFIKDILNLLNSNGYLILTTPRKEAQNEWSLYSNPNQPIEDWMTESALENLVCKNGFKKIKLDRFSISPIINAPEIEIYQLWLFQKTAL